ncbi:uncharacterized protein C8A04DRAFT_26201 [Dichotomopilus funicola]|uniref:Uncharacterized protein n=1 Tax=Dichotomopilus funicola TaxID=1934379 RepID=A0AAN6V752_9PEZI|nr:hypothetical protein C8A04DRAFT_26201 [Dichotomopilus funicola]
MSPQERIPSRQIQAYHRRQHRHHQHALFPPTNDVLSESEMGRNNWQNNYPEAFLHIDRRLEAMDQTMVWLRARLINIQAVQHNSQVRTLTSPLAGMVSVQEGENPHTPVGQPIPNFPRTVDRLGAMTAIECRILLESLDCPFTESWGWYGLEGLQAAVRATVGLTGW